MALRAKGNKADGGRPASGSIEIRSFKNGADASFWLHLTVDRERRSRRLGRASEGWTPVLAEAERRRVVDEIAAGIYREPTPELPLDERDPTFHIWASRWLAQRSAEIEKKTYEQYEYLLRRQLLPFFHRYRLAEITYRVVDEFKKQKIDDMRRIEAAASAGVTLRHADGRPMSLSPKTINHAINLLSTILGAAIRDEELDVQVNPADDRRLRVKIPKKSARDFLEADEVLTLLVAGEIVDNPVKLQRYAASAMRRNCVGRRSPDAWNAARPASSGSTNVTPSALQARAVPSSRCSPRVGHATPRSATCSGPTWTSRTARST
jgi:hypothetical protein